MLTRQIALVDDTGKISAAAMSQTAAALQKQATRDLGPIWNVQSTVDYFPDINNIPLGYWPIIILDNLNEPGAGGYHTDKHHQPISLVQLEDDWQLTCSHEMCEMLVDPYGFRMHASDCIVPSQGRVRYLVEACDPCEGAQFAYTVNGVPVSDFYTPHYFDPVKNVGTRYSYTGAISEPRQVLKDGYLSWHNMKDGNWYQATFFGSKLKVKNLSAMDNVTGTLRSAIDRITTNPARKENFKKFISANTQRMDLTTGISKEVGEHFKQEIAKYNTK